MPQIPNIPDHLAAAKGVEMRPPPLEWLPSVNTMVTDAVANLGTDQNGIFTVWVSTTAGVNAALVQKVGEHVDVVMHLGQTWGKPLEAGIAARVHW